MTHGQHKNGGASLLSPSPDFCKEIKIDKMRMKYTKY
jgi:hypothetical protein